MRVLIGCPVVDRAWIIDAWLNYAANSARSAGVEPIFALVGDPDDPTLDTAAAAAADLAVRLDLLCEPDPRWQQLSQLEPHKRRDREWHKARYHEITRVRNRLLCHVRQVSPDVFISVDSDILLAEPTVADLLESLNDYDAVGGLTWLGKSKTLINSGRTVHWGCFDKRPYWPGQVYKVDIVMALVAMGRAAYAVDYVAHSQGEDLGWSHAARMAGLSVGFDARTPNKHVMHRRQRHEFDPRCGY